MALLKNTHQLTRFRKLLRVYERGSGALNSWDKTFAVRIGSLAESEYEPDEWKQTWKETVGEKGRPSIFTDGVIRYLGIFLGTDKQVGAEWEARITKKIQKRYAKWQSLGTASTVFGKNTAIKSSVMSVAWYMTNNQTPPKLDDLIAQWEMAP